MPWGSAAVALSADAMRQGIRIRSVGGAFTHNGRRYPIGTAFIRNAENPADLTARLAALAVKHGAELVPIDSTWVDDGTSLGSNDVAALKTPKILLRVGRADAIRCLPAGRAMCSNAASARP